MSHASSLPRPTTGIGYEPKSGLYYEVLGRHRTARRPWLFIHGGGGTGAQFRAAPDGRPGWATLLAERGDECWLTDWPGSGRSGIGMKDPLEVDYPFVVQGYIDLLRQIIAEPVTVVCHSMGGAIAWKLVEEVREFADAVIAVAAAYPGNIAPLSEVVSDDGVSLTTRFRDTGVTFTVRRDRPYVYSEAYIYQQGIATSRRFPWAHFQQFLAGLVPMSPRLVIRRLGHGGGLPRVARTERFRGAWVRGIAGTEDPAHTRAIDGATMDLLRSWGADAELVWLGDRGITGNGHFVFLEDNSDEVLALVVELVDAHIGARSSAPVPRP